MNGEYYITRCFKPYTTHQTLWGAGHVAGMWDRIDEYKVWLRDTELKETIWKT